MLLALFILLLVLWALALMAGYIFNGMIHLLLIIALVLFVVRLVRGRRTAARS
jgi:hypothetical protein